MHPFFNNMPVEPALEIERLSRLLHELRENRAMVLAPWGHADEADLLAHIAAGEIDPHPAYEHYLSARILNDTRETVRSAIYGRLQGPAAGGASADGNPHLALRERLEEAYADRLDGGVELRQDALLARLVNGVFIEIRYAGAAAYSLRWRWGEAELAIDTAPVHGAGDAPSSHLHDAEGTTLSDPLTEVGRAPWDNIRAVIDAVLADPLLADRCGR